MWFLLVTACTVVSEVVETDGDTEGDTDSDVDTDTFGPARPLPDLDGNVAPACPAPSPPPTTCDLGGDSSDPCVEAMEGCWAYDAVESDCLQCRYVDVLEGCDAVREVRRGGWMDHATEWFGPDGLRVAWQHETDDGLGECGDERMWHGQRVEGCTVVSTTATPGCIWQALSIDTSDRPVDEPRPHAADFIADSRGGCFGWGTCETGHLVLLRPGDVYEVERGGVFDPEHGYLVQQFEVSADDGAMLWRGRAVEGCTRVTFTPSRGCLAPPIEATPE